MVSLSVKFVPSANQWLLQIFEAQSVDKGNIVRRQISDVERFASFDTLLEEVQRRGFHLIEVGDQYVIICNSGNFKLHC